METPTSDFTTSVFAHCPHCGATNGQSVSAKQFVCPDCAFQFFANPGAAVAVFIVNEAGEILFVRRGREPAKGKLNVPGGFVDPYEAAEEAIARETQEEVNLELRDLAFLVSFPNRYPYRGVVYHTLDMFFVAKAAHTREFEANEEVEQLVLRRPEEIAMEEIAFESTRRALAFYLRHKSG